MKNRPAIFQTAGEQRQYGQAYSTALSMWPVPFSEQSVPISFNDLYVIVSGTNTDWIDELFAVLDIEKAEVVGNSFGGYICALAAAYRPERISGIPPIRLTPYLAIVAHLRGVLRYRPAPENATTAHHGQQFSTGPAPLLAHAAPRSFWRSYSAGDRYPRLECNLTRL
jgi:pimeloyl-ACP methyl ester carboxylesterase